MAGYIGSKASVVSSGAEHKKTFTITGATTSLTGLNYTVGKVHVFQNGVRLVDGTDYTATNSTTITLTVAAQSGDNVVVISQASYQVALSGIDDQSNATAITIDSSENVGIGTSSPTVINTDAGIVLDVANTATTGTTADNAEIVLRSTSRFTGLTFKTPNDKASTINFGDTDDSDVGIIQYNHSNNAMSFTANASERMRIDSSGRVLVGKTASGMTANGVELRTGVTNDYAFTATSLNQPVLLLNRQTDDGMIIRMRKANSDVGNIGTADGNLLYICSNGNGIKIAAPSSGVDAFGPATTTGNNRDNTMDIGWSSNRFDDIYATNGSIQTSDFNEKQDIASLTATEMLVGKRISALFKTFRWKDSVAEKGDNARTHTGVIAKDVQAAFTAEGLDAGDYALFISSTWWEHDVDVPAVEAVAEVTDEDGNVTTEAVEAVDAYTRTDTYEVEDEAPEGATERTRMGIRYPELLSFVAAYNEQRFASIETRLTALEG